jgi:hypothetical protein
MKKRMAHLFQEPKGASQDAESFSTIIWIAIVIILYSGINSELTSWGSYLSPFI